MRTAAAAVTWEAAAKLSLLVLALSLLNRGCVLQQHRVLQQHVLLLLLLRALQQHEEVVVHMKHPTKSLVEQDCVSSGYWL